MAVAPDQSFTWGLMSVQTSTQGNRSHLDQSLQLDAVYTTLSWYNYNKIESLLGDDITAYVTNFFFLA